MGVRVHCLASGGVDLTSIAGKMTMSVIDAVAEFERDLLIGRIYAKLARAKRKGTALGHPSSLSKTQVAEVLKKLDAGDAVAALAREYDTSHQLIMRIRDAALAV